MNPVIVNCVEAQMTVVATETEEFLMGNPAIETRAVKTVWGRSSPPFAWRLLAACLLRHERQCDFPGENCMTGSICPHSLKQGRSPRSSWRCRNDA